jgi:mono/diheme cytochrome c family protein
MRLVRRPRIDERVGVWRLVFALSLSLLIGGLAYAVLLSTAEPDVAQAGSLDQSASEGQVLFQQKCVACHTIGHGKLVGPDLQGVTTKVSHDWLTRWITAPDQMLAAKDPTATQLLQEYNNVPMPNLGLTPDQVASLIAYLDTQAGAAQATPAQQATPVATASAAAPPAGDPAIGRNLFTGVTRFQNGGPPCMSCHNIVGIGALGGGALGPDLTPAYQKYGAAGIASILAGPPFPTMKPIFSAHPLTASEQANLQAFLQQASTTERPPSEIGELAVLAGVTTLVLLGLANLIWGRRLRGVRRPLVQRG